MAPRLIALLAAYNEADIIGEVVGDLIAQGCSVYLIDHSSTDGTREAAAVHLGKGLLAIERFPDESGFPLELADCFAWEAILERKEQLARALDADWLLHTDADELRESPFPDQTLIEAVGLVDRMGYNAIDFVVLNFIPTDDEFRPGTNLRQHFAYYEPAQAFDRLQIKCWKKNPAVDLRSSGGHEAQFAGRRVFPVRFINRHYPIRSQAQGERKVLVERKPRFLEAERARGWHVQYDHITAGAAFVREAEGLHHFDPQLTRRLLLAQSLSVEHESALARERQLRSETEARQQQALGELEVRARESEARAREFENRAHEFETRAHEFETRAHEFETRAHESENRAREFETRAHESENRAREFENRAREFETRDREAQGQIQRLLQEADTKAAAYDREIYELRVQLQAAEAQRQALVAEARGAAETHEQAIRRLTTEVAARATALTERERALHESENELAQARRHAEEQERSLQTALGICDELRRDLHHAHALAEEARSHLDLAREQSALERSRAAQAMQERDALRQTLENHGRENHERSAHLEAVSRQLREAHHEVSAKDASLRDAEIRIDQIYASRTWRWSAPGRLIWSFIRRS